MIRTNWMYHLGALLLGLGCSSSESSSDTGASGQTVSTSSATTTSSSASSSSGVTSSEVATASSTSNATSTSGSNAETATSTATNGSTSSSASAGGATGTVTMSSTGGAATTTSGNAQGGAASGTGGTATSTTSGDATLTFFVTSQTSMTGDLGGLDGADATCASLAEAVGAGAHTWRAYLSAENAGSPVNARERIGSGPWVNANGVTVAENVDELHQRTGDVDVFVDENGMRINGQWEGSPSPNQHDILTGSTADGELMAGMTCDDWTSSASDLQAQIGHSDGLGPGGSSAGNYSSWNSSHANQSCADTAPLGGAGRFYCFAAD